MRNRSSGMHVATSTRQYKGKTYKSYLLRRSYRKDGKVKKETLANLSPLGDEIIEMIRSCLKGKQFVPIDQAFEVIESKHHGHVKAVIKAMEKLEFKRLIASRATQERNLVEALIAARILAPNSKLATIRWWETTTLPEMLEVRKAREEEVCKVIEWLEARQGYIEKKLTNRHVKGEKVLMYDMSSSYFEGEECPLAKWGQNKDKKRGKKQVNYTLLTDKRGCPIVTRVYEGNYTESKILKPMIKELKEEFGIKEIVIVGDRGVIGKKQIEELKKEEGVGWIAALKAASIKKLIESGNLNIEELKKEEYLEFKDQEYEKERLIGCCNREVAEWKGKKRQDLLKATKEELEKIKEMVKKGSVRGKGEIGVRVGRVVNKYKVAKHIKLKITPARLNFEIDEEKVKKESELDGIYVIRTSLTKEKVDTKEVIRNYKGLSDVEQGFRSIKSVDLELRPIYHHMEQRVRGHIFLCMLAYNVKWHMMEAWRSILFADEEKGKKEESNPVKRAARSKKALAKTKTKKLEDGSKVHSFQTLLSDLSSIVRNTCNYKGEEDANLVKVDTIANKQQQRAYDLLEAIEM